METRGTTRAARARNADSVASQSSRPGNGPVTTTPQTSPEVGSDALDEEAVERRIAELTAIVEKNERLDARRRTLADLERRVRLQGPERDPAGLAAQPPRERLTPGSQGRHSRPASPIQSQIDAEESDDDNGSSTKRRRQEGPGLPQPRAIAAPKPTFYNGEGRDQLRTFLRTCEQQFRINPTTYPSDRDRVVMASGFLQGEVANSWDRAQEREGASEMTWAEFRGFLLDQLIPAAQRGWNTGRQWNDLRQKNGESV